MGKKNIDTYLEEFRVARENLVRALPSALEEAEETYATAQSHLLRLQQLQKILSSETPAARPVAVAQLRAPKQKALPARRRGRKRPKKVTRVSPRPPAGASTSAAASAAAGTIGTQFRQLREARKLSQRKAARLAKLSGPHLCNIEKGRSEPSQVTIAKLAKVYDVTPEQLSGAMEAIKAGQVASKA